MNLYLQFKEEVDLFREKNKIQVDGPDVPKPIITFEEASFPGMFFQRFFLVLVIFHTTFNHLF